jgi:hypothetical protein
MSDEKHAFGKICMWHGPLTFATLKDELGESSEETYACPSCGLDVVVCTPEAFWSLAAESEQGIPEYVSMLKWSQGKCFPDFTTMRHAWRRAMERLS